ncbi:MAG: ribulose 1,5-bisphosphate carboxylase large subunit, partial [Actinomycetota bacterium]
MIDPTDIVVSGERIQAVYEVAGPVEQARGRVEAICVEQTIEFPADLIADDGIRSEIIGRIETFDHVGPDLVRARVSYAVETTGFELPQLLNVLFGNTSLLRCIKLVDVSIPPGLAESLGGPRFGIEG